MNAKNKIVLATGVLLLAVGALWWKTVQATRRAEAALAVLKAERVDLLADVQRAEADLGKANLKREEMAQALAAVQQPKPAATDPAAKKANVPVRATRTMSDLIAHDPKAELAMIAWQKAGVIRVYASFFHAHQLSPEQIKRFEQLEVRRTEEYMDLRALARLENGPGEEELAVLEQRSKEAHEVARAELLGETLYHDLQEFERTMVVRNIVIFGFAGTAAVDGIPLTAQQGDQLGKAAVESAGLDHTLKGEELLKKIDWAALDKQAQKILSAPQYALFKSSAAETGFYSRWKYELDAAVRRAYAAEAGNPSDGR